MTSALLLGVAALVVLGLYARAVGRCRRSIQEGKASARRRADAALALDRASQQWDAHTARLATALQPLLGTAERAAPATSGFGDAIVAEERLRQAFLATDPPAALVEETTW